MVVVPVVVVGEQHRPRARTRPHKHRYQGSRGTGWPRIAAAGTHLPRMVFWMVTLEAALQACSRAGRDPRFEGQARDEGAHWTHAAHPIRCPGARSGAVQTRAAGQEAPHLQV